MKKTVIYSFQVSMIYLIVNIFGTVCNLYISLNRNNFSKIICLWMVYGRNNEITGEKNGIYSFTVSSIYLMNNILDTACILYISFTQYNFSNIIGLWLVYWKNNKTSILHLKYSTYSVSGVLIRFKDVLLILLC